LKNLIPYREGIDMTISPFEFHGIQVGPGTWILTRQDRTFLFSNVPAGVAVYTYPRETDYSDKPLDTGIARHVSTLGDIRFYDTATNAPFTDFEEPVTMQVNISDVEAGIFDDNNYRNLKKLLIQIDPDKPDSKEIKWKKAKVNSLRIYVDHVYNCKYAVFSFTRWEIDPPTGWGVGN
jgi:hypothetical protein